MSTLTLVDKNDNVIGSKDRALRAPGDIYRVTALWITNSRGEILLAQRAFTKKYAPGKWGPTVSGTVEADETYDTNIVKEIAEEIGLKLTIGELTKGLKRFQEKEGRQYFCQWYVYSTDKPADAFVLKPDEVEKVAWFTKEAIRKAVAERPEDFLLGIRQWANGEFEPGTTAN